MRNEVVSKGWYGKTTDWVPSREGWKKRKPLPVVRQGWSVRDRQAAAITEEERRRNGVAASLDGAVFAFRDSHEK